MKISEILWKAANEHLWDGVGYPLSRMELHSCCAASAADQRSGGMYWGKAREFIDSLLATDHERGGGFLDGLSTPDRQQVRYAWLMFASMVASEMEDRGEL